MKNHVNTTPLQFASAAGDIELCERLLENGANPNEVGTSDERTPLTIATKFGYTEIVRLLLKMKANPNLTNRNSQSALERAAWRGDTEIVKMILKAGSLGKFISAALMEAIKMDHQDIIVALIEAGADVIEKANRRHRNKTNFHKAAFSYSVALEKRGIVKIILEAGADVNKAKVYAAWCLRKEFHRLCYYYPKVSSRRKYFTLTSVGNQIPSFLKRIGADPNFALKSLLDYQTERASIYPETIKALVENGAGVNIVGEYGRTPLMLSTTEEMSEMMLEAGADIDIVDKDGNTALFWALSRGHFTVADKIIKERPVIQEIVDFNRRLALKVMVSHLRNIIKWY